MLHLLLIILVVIVIWKIAAGPGHANPAAIQTARARVQIVLALVGALVGGAIGYGAGHETTGAVVLGAVIGFGMVWGGMAIVMRIIGGFLGRS